MDEQPATDKETGAEHWERLAAMARERQAKNPLRRDSSASQASTYLLFFILILLLWWTFSPAQRWQYRIESVSDSTFDTEIDAMGNQGWELVFARRASSEVGDVSKEKRSEEHTPELQ